MFFTISFAMNVEISILFQLYGSFRIWALFDLYSTLAWITFLILAAVFLHFLSKDAIFFGPPPMGVGIGGFGSSWTLA